MSGTEFKGAIGIGIGCTTACVGVWQNERVEIIANAEGKRTTAVQSSSSSNMVDVISQLKRSAEAYLGKTVTRAVMTIPVDANEKQRQALKDFGKAAGLQVLRVINEPTAAGVAYGLDYMEGERNILIFDLGGSTCRTTAQVMDGGIWEVRATSEDSQLGGKDFTRRLTGHCQQIMKTKDHGGKVRDEGQLFLACEEVKCKLSGVVSAIVDIELLAENGETSTAQVEVSRETFESLCDDLFVRTIKQVEAVLVGAKMDKASVHDVVIVGGSSRIPGLQQRLSEFLGGQELNKSINPEEAVAFGASVQAYILTGGKSKQTEGLLLMDEDSSGRYGFYPTPAPTTVMVPGPTGFTTENVEEVD